MLLLGEVLEMCNAQDEMRLLWDPHWQTGSWPRLQMLGKVLELWEADGTLTWQRQWHQSCKDLRATKTESTLNTTEACSLKTHYVRARYEAC
jgi:hypothetical protein